MGTYDHHACAPHFALVALSNLSIFEALCCRILVGDGKKCLLFSSSFLLLCSCVCFLKIILNLYMRLLIYIFIVIYGCKLIHHHLYVRSILWFNLNRKGENTQKKRKIKKYANMLLTKVGYPPIHKYETYSKNISKVMFNQLPLCFVSYIRR